MQKAVTPKHIKATDIQTEKAMHYILNPNIALRS